MLDSLDLSAKIFGGNIADIASSIVNEGKNPSTHLKKRFFDYFFLDNLSGEPDFSYDIDHPSNDHQPP